MATNHHAQIRYQALDRCFRKQYKRFYIEDLIEACCQAIYDYSGIEHGVQRRQVMSDIAYMKSPEGWDAPIESVKDGRRVYYRYSDPDFSINSKPLREDELDMLRETIFMLRRFKGMPQFDWMEEILPKLEDRFNLSGAGDSVIGFDQNVDYTAAQRWLALLFNAIVNKQTLEVGYRKFDGTLLQWTLHPYYLKQYNNRWFLFGRNEAGGITTAPLDRIESVSPSGIEYVANTDIDFEEYFDDVIGVTIPDAPLEKIKLKFDPKRFPYVVSKPLHGSQRVIDAANGIIQIEVIPNKELESLILSFGNQVEVIAPQDFRNQIAEKISDLKEKYFTMHKDCINKQ
ncbi:MAG: WYL domain-containing protein [Bacteroidales bacterium]|nr:WYL domain-containing protein [Bacteroidales bacterium]